VSISPTPSELFAEVFDSHMGGIVRTCACGITTFNYTEQGCFEKGELEELESKQKSDPDHYRAVDYTVSTMTIGGEEIVHGCTCNKARQYEAFITGNARCLAEYLRRYANELRKRAEQVDVPPDASPSRPPASDGAVGDIVRPSRITEEMVRFARTEDLRHFAANLSAMLQHGYCNGCGLTPNGCEREGCRAKAPPASPPVDAAAEQQHGHPMTLRECAEAEEPLLDVESVADWTEAVPDWAAEEIRTTWRAAQDAGNQLESFRIIERMVDRLGYGRTENNPSLAPNWATSPKESAP